MKFIQNLSIRNKLLFVSLIPLAALLYFLTTGVMDKMANLANIRRVHNDVMEIEKVSDVIHNLMEERGYSISYVASGGKEKPELLLQRMETDKAISAFKQLLTAQKKNKQLTSLSGLSDLRNSVSQLTAD